MAPPMTRAVPIDEDLGDWIAEEAKRRVVGRRLLVNTAVRLLREAIERAPDLVDLPAAPPGEVEDLDR